MKISGWGNYPVVDTTVYAPRTLEALKTLLESHPNIIARGNGRAYGDSAINTYATVHLRHLNKILAFDDISGQMVAESGVILADIIAAFLPRGWFPQITPGTKFVTLGGMIAADVHGKNHHKEGSFRNCVDWIDIMSADGRIIRCSRESNYELFDYTIGGMGLTGVIVRAAIRLRAVETAWIRQRTIAAPNLQVTMDLFEQASNVSYSVAWIDCLSSGKNLGRSLVMLGEHAQIKDIPAEYTGNVFKYPNKQKLNIPFNFPSFTLNRLSVSTFNSLYYRWNLRSFKEKLIHWDNFFYPLDAIYEWNRIYGNQGFIQFQCVLPLDRSEEGLTELLFTIAKNGSGSFLAVLKRLGPEDGAFSFPMSGYTLALDFPVCRNSFELLDSLDMITIKYGGRFYLAKDSRLKSETLRRADRRIDKFTETRQRTGWINRFRSSQSDRLLI